MVEIDLVVFDMAGTTIRASDQIPAAFSEAFAKVGIALSEKEIQAVRGRSKHDAISELLDRLCETGAEQPDPMGVYGDFRKALLRRYETQGIETIDGVEDTFAWLRKRDIKIALTTGFDRNLADLLIRKVGWKDSFDAVVCNDDVIHGRPAPDMIFRAMEWARCDSVARIAVVGDTVSDLKAAEIAGVQWSIGVLSGAHSQDQLRTCPHTAIIPSVAELPNVLVGGQFLPEFRRDVGPIRTCKNNRQ